MPYMNTVVLMGHLAADPELRHLPSGDSVAMFTLGVNPPRSDQKERKGDFFQCDLWGGWAQNLVKTARKGSLVLVEGRLTQQRWLDPKTNEQRSRIVVLAFKGFHLKAEYADPREPAAGDNVDAEIKEFASSAAFTAAGEEDEPEARRASATAQQRGRPR